jgi:hypothetical protein
MADIKALKDAIWLKKEEIKKEEQGLADWTGQVSLAAANMWPSANWPHSSLQAMNWSRHMALTKTGMT